MRVLIAWGSKLGGTEGIARIAGEELARAGIDVDLKPAAEAGSIRGYNGVIVGGGLYANRWHRDARRFVTRNLAALRRVPVWMFSSGPLDDSADRTAIPPTNEVGTLMERTGALGHATFGGRLEAESKGFPAAAMAKTLSGDWRNPDRIRAWSAGIAAFLPTARPGEARDPPARSPWRLLAFGIAGWAACAAVMGGLMQIASTGVAIAIHAVAAPLVFAAISVAYFRARGAREPLPTAVAFTVIVALLDAGIVAALILRDFSMFASFAGTWLPFLLIFLATWITGSVMAMIPATAGPRNGERHQSPARSGI